MYATSGVDRRIYAHEIAVPVRPEVTRTDAEVIPYRIDSSSYLLDLIHFLSERRALPPGENVVVEVETVVLMPVGSGDLFALYFGYRIHVKALKIRSLSLNNLFS